MREAAAVSLGDHWAGGLERSGVSASDTFSFMAASAASATSPSNS
jgi:hypothetical protein